MTSSWAKTGCDEILIFTDIFPHHELTFKSHFSSREIIFFHCKGYVSNYVLEINSWKRQNQILVAERYEENNTKKKNKTKQKGKHEEWVCFVQMYLLSVFVLQMNFKLMTCSLTRPRAGAGIFLYQSIELEIGSRFKPTWKAISAVITH